MADDTANNIIADDSKPATVGNSPWDDDLPKEEEKKPMIVGALDGKTKSEEASPVPFNIPKDIIEQKDNEKVQAVEVVKTADQIPSESKGVSALIKPQAESKVVVPVSTSDPVPPFLQVPETDGPTIIHQSMAGDIKNKQQAPLASVKTVDPNQVNEPKAVIPPQLVKEQPAKPSTSILDRFTKAKADQPKRNGSISSALKKMMMVMGVLLIVVAGVFLTESGIMSFGFENIYGAIGVEGLWGGLSKNPETALAMALSKTSGNLEFKINGTITLSANTKTDSKIVGPLLSFASPNIALRDESQANAVRGVLAVSSDSIDDTTLDSSTTSDALDSSLFDSSTSSSTDTSSSLDSTPTSPTSSDLTDTSGSSVSSPSQQDVSNEYVPETTVVKEINAEFSSKSSSSGIETDLTIKKIIGTEENIGLILSGPDLLLKTSEKLKYSDKYQSGKWLDYQISTLKGENIFSNAADISPSSGFSIVGNRTSNEKIGGVRCYRYYLSKVELGDALSSIGIGKDMAQSISGDVWIGIKDKLIRKMDLTFIPSASSAVTKIHVVMNFTDYGVNNTLDMPAISDRIQVSASDSVTTGSTIGDTSTTGNTTIVGDDTTTSTDTEISRDQKRRNDLDAIKVALNQYKASVGRYPISSQLDKSTSQASILKVALVQSYLSEMPSDPKVSEGWYYGYTSSDGVNFTLSARIENALDLRSTVVGGVRLYWLKN